MYLVILAGCSSEPHVQYNADIRPILNERCLECHGGVKQASGFSLLFPEEAYAEANSGERAIVPGAPGQSEMLRRITHAESKERMPPEGDPLTPAQIALITQWIDDGAEWQTHWAFIPPEARALPEVDTEAWGRSPIDAFVWARVGAEDLAPNADAACGVLLRRVSLDVIGLPPSVDDVDRFCADPSDAAFEAEVDRLLASPRFGERWAAMWMDLARYGDSQGYQKDRHRDIWRYRDWLIDAFNRDLPFDQFTIEQLAGDLLPNPTPEQRIATAFHRNTMTNDEGGTDDEEFRVAAVLDRVNTTFEVWQGLTMACVQCHSHPYDPIRHEEYFQAYAFFNTSADTDRTDDYPTLTGWSPTQLTQVHALVDSVATDAERDELQAFLATHERGASLGLTPEHASYAALREANLMPSRTPVMAEQLDSLRRTTHVFERGNWLVHGEVVEPAVPHSLGRLPDDAPQNRLGLAQWLVSDANPLTARVTVNRFWSQLFGRGLVPTLEDFGTQGDAPVYSDLLDHLAITFRDDLDWSVKALLRTIVLSSTYRQSSHATPEVLERDPHNALLSRGPRVRLTAEQVRDQALAVSGLLSDKQFGPSVMPPQPEGVWNTIRHVKRWTTSDGEDRYRRALYTYWRRSSPYPSMLTFDSPSREFCVSRRVPTNTPLQSLVTLNDPVYVEAAQALARRMEDAAATIDNRLRHGYRLALAEPPSEATLDQLRHLYTQAHLHYGETPDASHQALTQVASVLLNLDAFMVKG
ncbi:MAG: hypothetical protein RhofKO_02780 [Rhodothermales bacterium]